MIKTFKRWYNKVRITLLRVFTNRVKQFDVKMPDGRRERVTVEQQQETVCAHTTLEQVDHILWRCANKKCEMGAYFFIPNKILATRDDLYGFLDRVADKIGEKLVDKDDEIT